MGHTNRLPVFRFARVGAQWRTISSSDMAALPNAEQESFQEMAKADGTKKDKRDDKKRNIRGSICDDHLRYLLNLLVSLC